MSSSHSWPRKEEEILFICRSGFVCVEKCFRMLPCGNPYVSREVGPRSVFFKKGGVERSLEGFLL